MQDGMEMEEALEWSCVAAMRLASGWDGRKGGGRTGGAEGAATSPQRTNAAAMQALRVSKHMTMNFEM